VDSPGRHRRYAKTSQIFNDRSDRQETADLAHTSDLNTLSNDGRVVFTKFAGSYANSSVIDPAQWIGFDDGNTYHIAGPR